MREYPNNSSAIFDRSELERVDWHCRNCIKRILTSEWVQFKYGWSRSTEN